MMRDVLPVLFAHGIGEILAHLHERWGKRPAREPLSPLEAALQARHDEIVRLARKSQPTVVPGLIRPDVEDRLVLSMPVFLYESRSRRCLFPAANRASRKLVWAHRTNAGKTVSISLVDRGTLELRQRQFIFTSARRKRVFSLDALTHFSATWSSIAIAAPGSRGISYFRGIHETRISFCVRPTPAEMWPTLDCEFNFRGTEIKEIVNLMQSASTPEPT
jgi:hypothetical protein